MQANSTIDIFHNEDGIRLADITLPETILEHMLNLNGKIVNGKKWTVREAEMPKTTDVNGTPQEAAKPAETTETTEIVNDPLDISYMIIDCRVFNWVWKQIKMIEVIDALEVDHAEDFTKSVGRLKTGIWSLDSDDFSRYIGKSIRIRGVDVQLKPKYIPRSRYFPFNDTDGPDQNDRNHRNEKRRREGTLITIFNAYKRRFRFISNELFDQAFEKMDGIEVIKQCEPQKTKGTTVLNNNRYLVVKTDDLSKKLDVGSAVYVMGMKFNIA